jgi:hypothetical protein
MSYSYTSAYRIGERVRIDGDDSISAIVTGITFRANDYTLISCDYFHNGDMKSAAAEEWRVSREPER